MVAGEEMNETVKAIWNKAASSHVQAETSWQTKENFMSRFAELIVEECCSQLYDRGQYSDGDWAKYRIRKHFGLEK